MADESMSEFLGGITDTASKIRAFRQKKAYEDLFTGNLNAKGDLNEKAFYTGVREQGLTPEQARGAMQYTQAQRANNTDIVMQNQLQRASGYNPQAAGRNNATYGAPGADSILPGQQKVESPSMEGAVPPAAPTTIDADKLRDPSEVGNNAPAPAPVAPVAPQAPAAPVDNAAATQSKAEQWFQSVKGKSKKEIAAVQAQVGAAADGKAGKLTKAAMWEYLKKGGRIPGEPIVDQAAQGDQEGQVAVTAQAPEFVSKAPEAKMVPDNVGPDVFAPAPEDNRSFSQMFEDSFNPADSAMGKVPGVGGSEPSPDLYKWEAKNDGSNAYRQFSSALTSMLNSNGYPDASAYLKAVGEAAYKKELPPAPNAALAMGGKEGMIKYQQQVQEYIAGLSKAEGARAQAVLAAKEKLAEFANRFGVQSHDEEKFNADMGGRRAGTVAGAGVMRTRAVSEAEKAIGDRTATAYQDIAAAQDQFASAATPDAKYSAVMQAINASLKADGASMNADNVVAFLVSSGMVPPVRAQAIKQLMSENPGGAMDAVQRLIKTNMVDGDPAQASKWFANRINNVRGQLKLVGYDVIGGVEPPAPGPGGKKVSGARKALESKAGKKTKSGHSVESF